MTTTLLRPPDDRTEHAGSPSARPRHRMRSGRQRLILHAILIVVSIGMMYPLLWMISSSFKPESEIFSNLRLIPQRVTLQNYIQGWTGLSTPFTRFFVNSFLLCFVSVIANCLSCLLTAYALARLRFPLRRVWFGVMIVAMMLPFHVTLVPQYIIFQHLGWVGTALPLIVPKFLASDTFFVFLLVQFIRSIPRELDDSAKIDGCGHYSTFWRIIMPLSTPALATVGIFTFLWTWNDFFSQLLYLGNRPGNFTIPVALNALTDATSASAYGQLLAMGVLSLIPIIGFFIAFQRLLIEGIATTGLKG